MMGLQASNQTTLMRNLVDDIAYLIQTVGFMPASNRTYSLSRSQPPVFALMVSLLTESQGRRVLINYLPALQQEYNFWMDGRRNVTAQKPGLPTRGAAGRRRFSEPILRRPGHAPP